MQSDSSLTEKTTQCDSLLQAVDQLKEKLEATEKRIEENEVLIQEKESKLEGMSSDFLETCWMTVLGLLTE